LAGEALLSVLPFVKPSEKKTVAFTTGAEATTSNADKTVRVRVFFMVIGSLELCVKKRRYIAALNRDLCARNGNIKAGSHLL